MSTLLPKPYQTVRTMKNRPILQVFCGLALAASTTFAASSSAQTAGHSPGWGVLPVEEYRTLHGRAYPIERETEPPPVEATLPRVDYGLHISGDAASGGARASGRDTRRLAVWQ